jgi:hypothetical protein
MHFSKCPARASTAAGILVAIATACGGATTVAPTRDAGANAGGDAGGSGNGNGSIGAPSAGSGSSGSSGGDLVLGSRGAAGGGGSVVAPVDAGPLSDVNVATFDAGPGWACYQAHCAAQLAKCSMEASCNNAIVAAVQCVLLGGADNQCFTPALGSAMDNDATSCILDVYTSNVCSPDGGASDASGG